MISHTGAYSRLVRPKPYLESGRNMFHRPAALAFSFSVSIVCVCCHGLPAARNVAISSLKVCSAAMTFVCTKSITRRCSSTTFGEGEKSMPASWLAVRCAEKSLIVRVMLASVKGRNNHIGDTMDLPRLRVGRAITPEQFELLSDDQLVRLLPRAVRE